MKGQWIQVASHDNRQFDAYLTLPPTGRGPGILLLQEAMGVTGHIRAVADQWAGDGFTVLAPDIYWRQQPHIEIGYAPEELAKVYDIMGKLDIELTIQDMASTVAALRARPECSGKIGAIGFCLGGKLSFLAAAGAGVDAAVSYYGGGLQEQLRRAAQIKVPLHFHFGEKDAYVPMETVEAVKATFGARGNVRIDTYPVGHGFNCWERSDYDQRSAALARGRSLAFLATQIC